MMRKGIFFKLLVALITTSLAVAITMAVFVQWSFRSGFEDFLRQQQHQAMGTLVTRLAESYRDDNGWELLRHDRRRWRQMIGQTMGRDPGRATGPRRQGRREESDRRAQDPPHRREGRPTDHERGGERLPSRRLSRRGRRGLPSGPRVRLLDSEQTAIFGPRRVPPGELRLPIVIDGETVGFIGQMPVDVEVDGLANAFALQQRRNYYLVAVIAVLASLLVSVLLARALVAPIRRIAASARQLAAGRYDLPLKLKRSDELGELARDVDKLGATLARNEDSRRQWIADISHELRTPLSVLRSETEAMLDGIRQVNLPRVQSLHSGIMTLAKLVDDLHTLTVSDGGAFLVDPEPVDLLVVVHEVLAVYRPRFADNNIDLSVDFDLKPGEAVVVNGDPRALYQVFSNLAENTHRYTDPGGHCSFRVTRDAATATVEVSDSAPGVPAQLMPKLFERLYRVDQSRSRKHGGSGLGLAICHNLIQAHGGSIVARESSLGGVCMIVELPLASGTLSEQSTGRAT